MIADPLSTKFSMTLRRYVTCAFIMLGLQLQAQEVFKGILVDSASFAPLAYVSVQVKGKMKGTTSDSNGNFGIMATRDDTLVFSLVGYQRLEIALWDYEASVLRMAERATLLQTITIQDRSTDNLYEGMFDDQNAALIKKKIPFYYSKARKDKIKVGRWKEENLRVQTYVDVVINDPSTKVNLMKKFKINEQEYYRVLTSFNERHYSVMYYLTSGELLSFLNRFFEENVPR